MNVSRRNFLKAVAGVAIGALAWDAGVNGGRPASAANEQPEVSGDEEPPE